MTPEEQERIRQLIAGAQRLRPSERDAFLSQSCGPDLALRAHVESLLAQPNNANTTTDGGHFEVANGVPADPNLHGLRLKGRYLLQNELGRGGFGVVYLAKDEQLHSKLVVIKVMPPSTADLWKRKKFRDEIEALARLNHPGIVSILDSGETDDGRLFLVMEYLKGEMLRALIPPGGMELERVAEIVRQVGRALDAAHREFIWHRDVKPENIMVHRSEDGDERIKLIDFGIASVDSLRTRVDPNTHIAGTISYMAPEQLRGMPSAASDIYSLGVVVYEMVTGRLPFPAANAVDLHAMQTSGVQVRPRDLRPDLPEEAEQPILKALQFAENDRPPTAMDFVRAVLEGLRAGTGTASPISGEKAGRVTGRRRFPLRRGLIAAMLLVAAGCLIFVAGRSGLGLWRGTHSGASIRSLAVLPFANAGGDPSWDYLADGVTESMINRLSRIRDLTVLSRAAVFRVKRDEPPLEQGRRLRVDAVLTGTIRHFADHLEASVELVDCATGRHLWGERYRQLFQDPLTFEKSAVEDTAAQLRARLDSGVKQSVTRNYTANLETYRLYLKGRYEWNKRSVKASDQAIQYFRQALDLDPSYALAWAGIADAYSFQSGYLPASEIFPKAQEAAHKALQLDPDLAEAHTSLGFVYVQYVWDWGKAEAEFRRALQLNPNYPSSHSMYARLLTVLGRFPEAEAEIAKAQVLDPLSLGIATGVALEYYLARDYLRAEQQLNKILRLEPTSYAAASYLALTRVAKGEVKAGIARYQQLLAAHPDDLSTMADLVRAYSLGGRAADGAALMDRIDRSPRYGTLLPTSLAEAHGALGKIDAAFADLDRAFSERCWYLIFLNVEPIFDPLRHDRRFRDIQKKMALAS